MIDEDNDCEIIPDEEEDISSDQLDYRAELLNTLKGLSRSGFEQVTVTGRSGDGGIDGIGLLQVNPFVSFKVLFQCKRFKETVGAPVVRNFRSAMMGRTDIGIIMTTGTFTQNAKCEARRDGVTPIELVDGEKLVKMFEMYELGLKPIKTYEMDYQFFEEFE